MFSKNHQKNMKNHQKKHTIKTIKKNIKNHQKTQHKKPAPRPMPLDPHVSRATEPWKSGLRHPSRHGRESSIFEENSHAQDPIVIYEHQ